MNALRHTCATRLAGDGATASEMMALLGHASLTTGFGAVRCLPRRLEAPAKYADPSKINLIGIS